MTSDSLQPPLRLPLVIAGLLILAMALTRFPVSGTALHLSDASWAVFFVAGFYLAAHWRWGFPVLMAVAVAVDLLAIQYFGISNYCVTVAYWFLVPAYAAMWLGGSLLTRIELRSVRGIGLVAASVLGSASLCFLISNASFYWLGGRVEAASLAGWIANFSTWYPSFVLPTAGYLAFACALHALVLSAAGLHKRVSN